MGKRKPRSVEKPVLGHGGSSLLSPGSLNLPAGPVYYPTEEEFRDPLEFIYKIRSEAEPYGICKIVPPKSWKAPFALDLESFAFPTKTQAIHQLQVRPPSCDSKTFELEYNRFLEEQCGKKAKKKVVFEGKDLDLCKLFNAVKRYGGYDNIVKEKKWGEVFRFVSPVGKISACAKHVLCQLYREHLYDYESYISRLNSEKNKNGKRGLNSEKKCESQFNSSGRKRRRKNILGDKVEETKVENEEFDQICKQCRSGLHGEVMLLCDRCNKGWHTYCLSPPLKRIPPGNWYCSECLNSEEDTFGFVPGKQFSLEAFKRLAIRAKKKWFGSTSPSRVQLEKKFWEIVEGSVGEVEVMYGSDLDTSVYGSGFPRVNDQRPPLIAVEDWEECCASPWNLNNLPKLKGSMLQAVPHSIAGVMVPWLYIGMLFSSFCWHFEDHCFYSMNYHHWGEPKCWYSVPGSEADAFEKVMRDSLPDLFDVQPDLLFQLVTMLNPSVLQHHNVPVYSVLQEPGNFVITFPRSYHGGFNFGLNCAEAVNFAPADWLPHGGFGAELYQLYRKPAVLSHEELLCVVAKSDIDNKASPYLKKELIRIYSKERTWRERLWKNGIIRSSPMSPRKKPKYVGVEEDPACIICQQYLYLSAVGCHCRPSAFVCLEHWEHLCECKPQKRYLLYRHTLAELNDLVLTMEKYNSDENDLIRSLRKQLSSSSDSVSLSKKVKGEVVTLVQLAEEWLLRACKILQMPYSNHAYTKVLKEAEQFLWAGSEMDSVREMAKNLAEAHNWAEGVKDCLSRVELWLHNRNRDLERVKMEDINSLLRVDPVPCNEPGHLKLKVYEEEARVLIQKINSSLSKDAIISIVDWENLYSEACESAIHVKESDELSLKLSSTMAWIKSVRKCISVKCPATVEIDTLYGLKSQISELKLQLPETEMLLDFLRQVESCQCRCKEMLKSSITLKALELLVHEFDGFTVNIPELELLRQYQNDALSWVSCFNNVMKNVHEREDQENVVEELICMQKDGKLLKIQVDELPHVEIELKKASCRVEARKVLRFRMPLEFIRKIMGEATVLQIEKEKLFLDISRVHDAALCWEERAKHILASEAQMSEFEDALRASEDLCAILPSLDDVKEALSIANAWLTKSKPYLVSGPSVVLSSSPLLEIEMLKELSSESKRLKISLKEKSMLEAVLKNCLEWEHDASSSLLDAESLLNIGEIGDGNTIGLLSKIKPQVDRVESLIKAGLALHFDYVLIPELQDACSTLHWCSKTLSFQDVIPTLEEVEMLLEAGHYKPGKYASSPLRTLLIDGLNWLRKALEISLPSNLKKYKLKDAEEALEHSQIINLFFPLMGMRLANAVERHNDFVEQVSVFFNLDYEDRPWSLLLQLKELGSTSAFDCLEMDKVLFEVGKVQLWKKRSEVIAGPTVSDNNLLCDALLEIRKTLDKCLYIYSKSNGCKEASLCICCSGDSEDQEILTCSLCKDCYHIRCMKPTVGGRSDLEVNTCPYCLFIENGKISRSGSVLLKMGGKRPELSMLARLLSDADNLCVRIDERNLLEEVVEKALKCAACLTETLNFALASLDKDPSLVVGKLSAVLKAVEMAGIYDPEGNSELDVALARNSWRVRARRLLEASQKPTIQQIQRHLKEGSAISIPLEDHFWQKLSELKHAGLQWADTAKKVHNDAAHLFIYALRLEINVAISFSVSTDSGELELDKVFELISEGENLSVHFEKELKELRERSMLYCICRKPYDKRAMIACDKCDEWYHFDCINLLSPPKSYICPACKPNEKDDENHASSSMTQERSSGKCEEPQTPSPRRTEVRRKLGKPKKSSSSSRKRKMVVGSSRDESTKLRQPSGIERLLWRNRKPYRRVSRKRVEFDILSPFFHAQQQ